MAEVKLSLNPNLTCTLTLDGRAVELSASELNALRECMPDTDRRPEVALPKDLFRRLFEAGIIIPSSIAPSAPDRWRTALPSLALSPYLRLEPSFGKDGHIVDGIEPSIAQFLQAEFVEAAQQISRVIRSALGYIARACAVRGVVLPRDRAAHLIYRLVGDGLRRRPELSRWVRWEDGTGSPRLSILDYAAVVTSAPSFPDVHLTVSAETGRSRYKTAHVTIPIQALPALAQVLDALRDGTTAPPEAALENASVRRVLRTIDSVDGFIPRVDAPLAFPAPGTGAALRITHLGHAFLVADAADRRVLIDPRLFPWENRFEKQPLTAGQLGRIDAILFTHHHEDHLEPSSLFGLPHDVPVFVPALQGAPLEPRLRDFLRLMGFADVRELAHGQSYDVGSGLNVESVPFFGEGKNLLGFGANCYLISRRGQNVLVHADASPDNAGQSLLSHGVVDGLVARRGPIRVVFGSWWQEREFVCKLSPLAIFTPGIDPRHWLDDTEMCHCTREYLVELLARSRARLLVTYAESGKECFLPKSEMSEYIPAASLLWTSLAEIRRRVTDQIGADVVEAQPYLQVVLPEGGGDPGVARSGVAHSRQDA